MTKNDLMKKVYTKNELRNVDSAIPANLWPMLDTTEYVMDYNDNSLGRLVNLYARLWFQEQEINTSGYVTVLDFTNGKIEIIRYSNKEIFRYDNDIEEWLRKEKGFGKVDLSYMCNDYLNLEIH